MKFWGDGKVVYLNSRGCILLAKPMDCTLKIDAFYCMHLSKADLKGKKGREEGWKETQKVYLIC